MQLMRSWVDHAPQLNEFVPRRRIYNSRAQSYCDPSCQALKVPDAKVAQPDAVASVVSHLASLESYFITGTLNIQSLQLQNLQDSWTCRPDYFS